jgi:hypothetical protein
MRSLPFASSVHPLTSVHRFAASTPPLSTAPFMRPSPWPDQPRPAAPLPVGVPLALAAVLLSLAVLVAPERPADQEAICQRHNGAAACRVW